MPLSSSPLGSRPYFIPTAPYSCFPPFKTMHSQVASSCLTNWASICGPTICAPKLQSGPQLSSHFGTNRLQPSLAHFLRISHHIAHMYSKSKWLFSEMRSLTRQLWAFSSCLVSFTVDFGNYTRRNHIIGVAMGMNRVHVLRAMSGKRPWGRLGCCSTCSGTSLEHPPPHIANSMPSSSKRIAALAGPCASQ